MRKFLLSSLLVGLVALPFAACDVEDDADADTTVSNTDPGTTTVTEYHGIMLQDSWVDGSGCPSKTQKAQGADIDAVGLFDSANSLVGYCDVVQGNVPGSSSCGANNHTNTNDAKGAPDGDISSGYVALTGGVIACEFAPNSPKLTAGDSVEVYEIDTSYCSGCDAEGYTVSAVTSAACATSACTNNVGLGTGAGVATLSVTGI